MVRRICSASASFQGPSTKEPKVGAFRVFDRRREAPQSAKQIHDPRGACSILAGDGCAHKSNGKKWGWNSPPLREPPLKLACQSRQNLGMARRRLAIGVRSQRLKAGLGRTEGCFDRLDRLDGRRTAKMFLVFRMASDLVLSILSNLSNLSNYLVVINNERGRRKGEERFPISWNMRSPRMADHGSLRIPNLSTSSWRLCATPRQPMARRQKAATRCGAVFGIRSSVRLLSDISGDTFAAMLDRAIERSGKGREIKQIDAELNA